VKLGTGTRRGLLFGALALTLVAVQWVDGNDDTVRKPRSLSQGSATPRTAPPPASASPGVPAPAVTSSGDIDLGRLQRGRGAEARDAFAPRNWQPPPRKLTPAEAAAMAAAEPPPPPPQAPPLPFVYVGMLAEESRTTVFLSHGARDIAVRSGDTIDNTYRVDAVTPDRIEITYLPLNQRQTLPLGTP
jgi:hypothetical protein